MTTPTLSEIRQGVATQLASAINTVTFYPRQPLRLQLPALFLRRSLGPSWGTVGSGSATVTFELVLVVDSTLAERASEVLDTLIETTGSASIRGALEADRQLGGKVLMMVPGDWGEEELIEVNGVLLPGSVMPLEVQYR